VGYEIRSLLDWQTLRGGSGSTLVVQEQDAINPEGELLITWEARPGNPFHGRLLRTQAGYAFWANDAGWYLVEPERQSITMSTGKDPLRRELRLFGIPTAICTFLDGDISVHASAVDVGGRGVLIAGPSMYGKTTLAAAFAASGHRMLCEDTTRCDPRRREIYPGPAALRLRADVAAVMDVPGARPVWSADEGRVPLVFDDVARGNGNAVPLALIVLLREPSDVPELEAVSVSDAARDLMALTFRVPTSDSIATAFSRVVDLSAATPSVALHRPLTTRSLGDVVRLIEDRIARD
jgi:hypothetical protein